MRRERITRLHYLYLLITQLEYRQGKGTIRGGGKGNLANLHVDKAEVKLTDVDDQNRYSYHTRVARPRTDLSKLVGVNMSSNTQQLNRTEGNLREHFILRFFMVALNDIESKGIKCHVEQVVLGSTEVAVDRVSK